MTADSTQSTTDAPADATDRPPTEDFVQLFTTNQRRLYHFILPQVTTTQNADEVLQETNLIIWNKYQQFTLGTNFFAWAAQIATYEVLKFRQRRHREKLQFSDSFLETVAAEALERGDELEERRVALAKCLKRLRAKDRKLIQLRYRPGESGKALAAQLGRPANSVYQSLGRIRRTLLDCINRRLAVEAAT